MNVNFIIFLILFGCFVSLSWYLSKRNVYVIKIVVAIWATLFVWVTGICPPSPIYLISSWFSFLMLLVFYDTYTEMVLKDNEKTKEK